MGNARTVLRVERGQAGPEELAAVASVLLALLARGPEQPGAASPAPGWGRWKRPAGYAAPGSWW